MLAAAAAMISQSGGGKKEKVADSSSVAVQQQQLPSIHSPDLSFPWRLFLLLKNVSLDEKQSNIISWTNDGKSFQVHKKQQFEVELLPKFFKMSKYKSFTRQLCGYGFTCIKQQQIQKRHNVLSIWSHPDFSRDNPDRCSNIKRKKKTNNNKNKDSNSTSGTKSTNHVSSKPTTTTTTTTHDNNAPSPNMSAATTWPSTVSAMALTAATTAISPNDTSNKAVGHNNNCDNFISHSAFSFSDTAAPVPATDSDSSRKNPENNPNKCSRFDINKNFQMFSSYGNQQSQQSQHQHQQLQQLQQWSQQLKQQQAQNMNQQNELKINKRGGTKTKHTTTNNIHGTNLVATSMYQTTTTRNRPTNSYSSSSSQKNNTIISDNSDTDGGDDDSSSNNSCNYINNNTNSNLGNGNNPARKKPPPTGTRTLSTIPERITTTMMSVDNVDDHHQDQQDHTMNEDERNNTEEDWFEPLLLDDGIVLDDINFNQQKSLSSRNCSSSAGTRSTTNHALHNNQSPQQITATPTIKDLDIALESLCSDDDDDDSNTIEGDKLNFSTTAGSMLNNIDISTGIDMDIEPRSIEDMATNDDLQPTGGSNRVNNDDNNSLLEPRRIEEMIVEPLHMEPHHLWYDWCPTLKPTQQALMEYSLPLVLPSLFYILKFSRFGLVWCMVLVTGHTVETLFTSFGPNTEHLSYRAMIVPIQHHLIDAMWLHTLISAMLIWPHQFGERDSGYIIGLCLIQTLPIYLSVSFKTHFTNYVLPEKEHHHHQQQHQQKPQSQTKMKSTAASEIPTHATTKLQQVRRMRGIIRNFFLWYIMSTLGCIVGEYFLSKQTDSLNYIKTLSLFMVNITPLKIGCSYMHEFGTTTRSGVFATASIRSKKSI